MSGMPKKFSLKNFSKAASRHGVSPCLLAKLHNKILLQYIRREHIHAPIDQILRRGGIIARPTVDANAAAVQFLYPRRRQFRISDIQFHARLRQTRNEPGGIFAR